MQQRAFKKKSGKGGGKKGDEPTEEPAEEGIKITYEDTAEPVEAAEPEVKAAPVEVQKPKEVAANFKDATKEQPAEKVDKSLYVPFSLGDVKRVDSTPDHKPPTLDDTIEGRYASVLFTSASQKESLFIVYEDIVFIKSLYDNSESFKLFTRNGGVGAFEINKFNKALQEIGDFDPLTIRFLEVLAENKRLTYFDKICDRYVKLYQ